ncbi:DUF2269 family protein [Hoeflea sp.]|uniref:DUF2269 family protein n=1 Tax=Hoeflea sp. TaxID=1940281 RepID=UPI003BAE5FF7
MTLAGLLLVLHVIGAAVLLGTGSGIAFFMLMAVQTRDPRLIAHVSGTVVLADLLFTATAAVAQPVTGVLLAYQTGWSLGEGWILVSLGLYVFIGLFWLPVVWIQIRLRDLAREAAAAEADLSERFWKLYRIWFACGFPAFFAILVIFWLMLNKPQIGF